MASATWTAPKSATRSDIQPPPIKDRAQLEDVTVCMTAFRRPRKVEAQLESLRKYYPQVKVIIGDNGDDLPNVAEDEFTRLIQLPFDSGISKSRNFLYGLVTTPFILTIDDDNLWTENTQIERFLSVLDHDPKIGIVGGWQDDREKNQRIGWHLKFHEHKQELSATVSRGPVRITSDGVPYWETDSVLNFSLARKELFENCAWADDLKMCEHWEYFYRLKQFGKWRVVFCPWVGSIHDPLPRAKAYTDFRFRKNEFEQSSLNRHGLTSRQNFPWSDADGCGPGKPNLIILTPGHTGSSVITAGLHQLGWNAPEDYDNYSESKSIRAIHDDAKQTGNFDQSRVRAALAKLPQPWAIKDPRFSEHLLKWLPELEEYAPTLVYLSRDAAEISKSFQRRGESWWLAASRVKKCQEIFAAWPWSRLEFDFDDIASSVQLFDTDAIGHGYSGLKSQGGD